MQQEHVSTLHCSRHNDNHEYVPTIMIIAQEHVPTQHCSRHYAPDKAWTHLSWREQCECSIYIDDYKSTFKKPGVWRWGKPGDKRHQQRHMEVQEDAVQVIPSMIPSHHLPIHSVLFLYVSLKAHLVGGQEKHSRRSIFFWPLAFSETAQHIFAFLSTLLPSPPS